MTWTRRWKSPLPDEEARVARRLLEAAADPAERREPPPFFAARVRAQAVAALEANAHAQTAHPLGLAARQLLPLLGIAVMVLTAWTGYETYEAAQTRSEVIKRTLANPEALDEAVMVALLFDSSGGGTGQ